MADENSEPENRTEDASEQENGPFDAIPPENPDTHDDADAKPLPDSDGSNALTVAVQPNAQEFRQPALAYPIVAFGASAGGLPALREILDKLDPATGMAFVIVTHLSPDHPSLLTEIVGTYTSMPVLAAETAVRPEPNHIYILQPNQLLRIREGVFQAEERHCGSRNPLAIDTFMRSLAADQKNHAVGVILSGADGDGAAGLKAIKGEGGLALVQSPDTAVQPGMPRSSIAADHVDLVIPPAEIALELGRIAYHFTRAEIRSLEEGAIEKEDEQSFQRILQLVRTVSGLELRHYKPETLRRRIARRMVLLRKDSLAEFYRFLQLRPDQLRLLEEDLLIPVTRFFRDPGFWESLREHVLPALFQGRSEDRPLRIWCAGCSSGEEVYSLAITVTEYLSAHSLEIPVQIFGTDASDQSIELARTAIYPESVAADISPERLRRFFVKVERGYQVSKRIRDTCIFARQNLCSDPPFSHIDILSCRNVMIYFNQTLQRQVLLTFHYALEPHGYMLLGMSEGLRDYTEIFAKVDLKHKIYLKTGIPIPRGADGARNFALAKASAPAHSPVLNAANTVWPELELQRATDRLVLARFGPPGLVVDERMNVLQSRGHTAPFVDLAAGRVSWHLSRVLREDIAHETRIAVQRAIRENIPTATTATLIHEDEEKEHIQIEVLPITAAGTRARCFLVLFNVPAGSAQRGTTEPSLLPHLMEDEKERLIVQLREDLSSIRVHLHSLVEERDLRNQELVSANEEIQSANEELQSTNEELETTKEELQSANEELQTVNDELQQRNNALAQTGNDLTNLLNSVNIPLLMLTSNLSIRQFTPSMERLLSVRRIDIGRSITEIRLQLSIEDITPILRNVLDTLGTHEEEVQDREGRWHLLRVRPYRTAESKVEGLVVVLLDINQLRSSQQDLLEAHHFTSSVVESVPVSIVVLNQDCSIRITNNAFRELVGLGAKELEGRSLPDLAHLLWGIKDMREQLSGLLRSPLSRLQIEHESTTPNRKMLLIKGQALVTDGGHVLLVGIEDLTVSRIAERLVAEQKAALENEVQLVTNILTRTKEELRGLTGHLFTVQEEERRRIARELHDDVGQRLSAIQFFLTDAENHSGASSNPGKLSEALKELQTLQNDVRQMSHRLHPAILEDLGVPAALHALADEFQSREGMPASFMAESLPERWPESAATALYRITQEALRNVAKHAGKTHVKISLQEADHTIQLKVMDFGLGFDQEENLPGRGLGLISMQERARMAGGTFQIESSLGQGATVTVRIPLRGC